MLERNGNTVELFSEADWNDHKRMPPCDPGCLRDDYQALLDAWAKGPENVEGAEWGIPPACGNGRQIVGEEYPYQRLSEHKG